ncbi:F-box/kelch-repeat protein At3g17530-like [Nicotiana tabacum]|uniref:F-box/kelch-repeat protein At3g17530-like n=1 Tax=Nicotiana tabacum TaxID=4097 RepID=A0A1S3WYZ0_TOBAC|nr:PREDICTED: F-box/kelch-repeat protein At3g17530-like [Nicotiana tabacum]
MFGYITGDYNLSRMTTNIESYSQKELVTDHVLLRLPVKSLFRFKCVCKSWHDLIKSSNFIKKHFNSESNRLRLMLCKFGVNYNKDPGCVPTNQRIYRCEDVGDFRCIYGPINGIFLLEKGHYIDNVRFAWWNPATKECRLIPRIHFEVQQYFEDNNRRLGIGIDLVNQDYKVIWHRTFWDDMTSDVYPKVYAAVYSTKNDSWKFLEPEHTHLCQICISQNCTYMNGVYYWISTSQRFCKEDNVYFIRTFDLATELFGEMTGPPIPGEHWASLMLRGGSLAAMSCDDVTQAMTANYGIWVRIRENNWIKAYTVNPPIPSHYPIGIWEYDKFIFELTQTCRLVFYDQTVKQVTSLGFHFYDLSCGSNWAISYKESLVPIKNEKPTDKDNAEYFLTKY